MLCETSRTHYLWSSDSFFFLHTLKRNNKEDDNPTELSEFAGLGSVLRLVPVQTIRLTSSLELLHICPEAKWFHTLAFNWYGGVCQVYWACLILLLSFKTALHSLWFVSSFGVWRMFSTGDRERGVPETWLGSLFFRKLCYGNLTAGQRILVEKNPVFMD